MWVEKEEKGNTAALGKPKGRDSAGLRLVKKRERPEEETFFLGDLDNRLGGLGKKGGEEIKETNKGIQ